MVSGAGAASSKRPLDCRKKVAVAAAGAAALLVGEWAGAAGITHDQTSSGAGVLTWSGATWTNGVPDSTSAGDTATFSSGTATVNEVLDINVTIGQLVKLGAGNWLLKDSGTHVLTMNNTGGTNNPFGNNTAFIGTFESVNSGAGTLTVQAPIVMTGDLIVGGIGNGVVGASGAVSIQGGLSGTGDLYVASGAGFTSGLTFSTAAINNTGKLIVGRSASATTVTGTGAIAINSGVGSNVTDVILNQAGTLTVGAGGTNTWVNTGNITFAGTGAGTTTGVTGVSLNNAGTITNSGLTTGSTTLAGGIGSNVVAIVQNSTTSRLLISTTALTVNSGGTTLSNLVGERIQLGAGSAIVGTGNLTLNNNSAGALGINFTAGTINHSGLLTASGSGVGDVSINAGIGPNVGNIANTNIATLNLLNVVNNTGTITNTGTGTLNFGTASGIQSGVTALVMNNANGKMMLQGANPNFAGQISVSAGTLDVRHASAFGAASSIRLAAGAKLDNSGASVVISTVTPFTWEGDFTFAGTGTGALNAGTGAVSMTGDVILTNATTIGRSITFGGTITGAGNLTANSFNPSAPATGLINLTGLINNTGTFTTAAIGGTGNGQYTLGAVGSNVTDVVLAGRNAHTINGAVNNSGNLTVSAGGISNGITFNAQVNSAAGAIVSNGVSTGLLSLGGGTGSNIKSITNSAPGTMSIALININAGGTTVTTSNGILNGVGTGAISTTGTGDLTLKNQGAAALGMTFSTALGHTGKVLISGTGTGGTRVTGGINATVTDVHVTATGGAVLGGDGASLLNSGNIALSGSGESVSTLFGTVNNAGAIVNNGTTTGTTTITGTLGSGVTMLSQNSSTSGLALASDNAAFVGSVNVQSGTLTLNALGTLTNASSVNVASGGVLNTSAKAAGTSLKVLGGGGTLTGADGIAVTVVNALRPGDGGVGTLAVSAGNLSLTSGATYHFDINGALGDTVTLTGPTSTVVLGGSYTLELNAFDLPTVDTFVLFDSGAAIASAGTWAINYGNSGMSGGSVFLNPEDNTQLMFTAAVPEPGMLGVASLGLVGLLRRRRRNPAA